MSITRWLRCAVGLHSWWYPSPRQRETVLSKVQDQNAQVLTPDLFHIVRADEAVIKDKIVIVLSDGQPSASAQSGQIREIPVPADVWKRTAAQELADPLKFPKLK